MFGRARLAPGALLVLFAALVVAAWFGGAPQPAVAVGQTFVVKSSADGTPAHACDASCRLRDAIHAANLNPGLDTITFDPAVTSITYASEMEFLDATDGATIGNTNQSVAVHACGSCNFGIVFVTQPGVTAKNITVNDIHASGFLYDGLQVCGGVDIGASDCFGRVENVTILNGAYDDNGNNGIRILGDNLSNIQTTAAYAAQNGNNGISIEGHENIAGLEISLGVLRDNTEAGISVFSPDMSDINIHNLLLQSNDDIGLTIFGPDTPAGTLENLRLASFTSTDSPSGVRVDMDDISQATLTHITTTGGDYGVEVSSHEADDVEVDHLDVDSVATVGFSLASINATNVRIHDNSWTNSPASLAVWLESNTQGGTFDQVSIADNTMENAGGIFLAASFLNHVTIEDNTIHLGTQQGINFAPLTGGTNNVIRRNTVSGMDGTAIQLCCSPATVTFSQNSTFGNGGRGIDLDPAGVNANDPGDGDTGPNTLLNFPEINDSTSEAVTGTTCGNCLVELFLADNDPSGHGEGQTYLGSAEAFVDGDFGVRICGLDIDPGSKVTATATDANGNTSEFSENFTVTVGSAPACPTETPGPTPPPTPTHAATPTEAPTPSGTAAAGTQGDLDCDGSVTPLDALLLLFHLQGLPLDQEQPCPQPTEMTGDFAFADVNCDGVIDADDAMAILAFFAGSPLEADGPCLPVGDPF